MIFPTVNPPDDYDTQWIIHPKRGVLGVKNERLITADGFPVEDLQGPFWAHAHYGTKAEAVKSFLNQTFVGTELTECVGPPFRMRE